MSKYQVTIYLVVEVEADTQDEACSEAKHSIDYNHGDVIEEDIHNCELLELRCTECCEEMDMGMYDEHDRYCQECEEAMSEEENEE